MRFGIVAVDPAIIPLRSQVCASYGLGDALNQQRHHAHDASIWGYDDSNS